MKAQAALAAILSCAALAAPAERSVWDGVYTEAQAARGQEAYQQHCASCHGDTLTGGETAPPLAGGEFLANWNGLTIGDLMERVRQTMPPATPGKLSRVVNAEILSHILKVNDFPPGETEMPSETGWLKEIRIEWAKPRE
jgi:mono/diheme cytochrome c family protein